MGEAYGHKRPGRVSCLFQPELRDLGCSCHGVACLWEGSSGSPRPLPQFPPTSLSSPSVRGQSLCGLQSRLARTPSPSSSSQPPPFCSPSGPFMGWSIPLILAPSPNPPPLDPRPAVAIVRWKGKGETQRKERGGGGPPVPRLPSKARLDTRMGPWTNHPWGP